MVGLVFLLVAGVFCYAVYCFCRGYKEEKELKSFLAELKSTGIKPKIINATLNGGAICVYAENYGLLWKYAPYVKHDSDDSSQNRTYTSGHIIARDLHWNEDTVTATFEGRDKYGSLIDSITVTLNVYREIL